MKATELKCPKCGAVPDPNAWTFELVEPATAYRRLEIHVNPEGDITLIHANDIEYDDGDGEKELNHRGCGGRFPVPKGFWDFDVYG